MTVITRKQREALFQLYIHEFNVKYPGNSYFAENVPHYLSYLSFRRQQVV